MNTINNLGNAFDCLGEIFLAKNQYDLALKICDKEFGPNHSNSALALRNRGNIEFYYGNHEEALSYYHRAMSSSSGEDAMFGAKLFINLASVKSRQGFHDLAHEECTKALVNIAHLGENNLIFAMAISTRCALFLGQTESSKAMGDYEQALKMYKTMFGGDSVQSMETIVKIGNLHHAVGHYDKAIECFESVYNFYENVFGKDHINMDPIIRSIGCGLKRQGNYDDAKERYIHAIMIYRKALENLPFMNMADELTENLVDLSLEDLEGRLQRYERHLGKAHLSWPDTIHS